MRKLIAQKPRMVLSVCVLASVFLVLFVITRLGRGAQTLPARNKPLQRPVVDGDGDDDDFERMIEELRATQFPQLKDQVYLDYMGAGQYQKGQIEDYMKEISTHLYCNTREFFSFFMLFFLNFSS